MSPSKRDVNTHRARVFGPDTARVIGFVCECGDPGCRRTVALTLAEYNRRRPGLIVHEVHGHRRAG
jgi:hypothetical protein